MDEDEMFLRAEINRDRRERMRNSVEYYVKRPDGKVYKQNDPKIQNAQNTTRLRRQLKLVPRPAACEVCGRTDRKITLDHCHVTNKVRGWLCLHCNVIIGHAHDDPDLLEKLAAYLRKHPWISDETDPLSPPI